MRILFINMISIFFFVTHGLADNFYRFENYQDTYTELTNDTAVHPLTSKGNSGYLYTLKLKGSTFHFFNKEYRMNDSDVALSFSTDGHFELLNDDNSLLIFDGLFTYLDSIDGSSKVSYRIEGSGNDRIIKVQWKNLKLRYGPPGNYINFQMWLYQATGVVEMRYGKCTDNVKKGFADANGPNVGMFYSKIDFTEMYEKVWLNGLPPALTIDSKKNTVFKGLHGVPAEGTVYRFYPRNTPSPVNDTRQAEGHVQVFPNPASTKFSLQWNRTLSADVSIQISDLQGRIISRTTVHTGMSDTSFDTGQLPDGLYLLTISGTELCQTRKVYIRH